MQSFAWGEFNRAERGMKPHCVGMEDEGGSLVAAALLLERKPPLFPPYFYSPRGFVVDFFDGALLERFTKEVAGYCKRNGAMFLKIDPDIERRTVDAEGSPVAGSFNNECVIKNLQSLGFRHLGFNSGFEHRQPRFTFRIDLSADEETIKKRIVGNVMKNVRKGERYSTEICEGDEADTADLYRLITETSERDDFYAYSESFYRSFYRILHDRDMVTLYMGKTFPRRIVDDLSRQLEELLKRKKGLKKEQRIKEAEESERRLLGEIEKFEEYAAKYGDEAVTNAHLVVRYGEHAWAVHAGSSTDMKETFLNNRIYLYKILDQKEKGAVWLDQFGTIGNPKDNPLKSLHEFKRQFGGRYVEFIGEFDMVFKPFWYFLYEKALPKYRALRFGLKEFGRKRRNKS